MSSTNERIYGMKQEKSDLTKYDSAVSRKINFAKASRLEYRIVIKGKEPADKSMGTGRLNIVVTEDGKFVSTYYG